MSECSRVPISIEAILAILLINTIYVEALWHLEQARKVRKIAFGQVILGNEL